MTEFLWRLYRSAKKFKIEILLFVDLDPYFFPQELIFHGKFQDIYLPRDYLLKIFINLLCLKA
jgi:hypothetical protein